MNTRKTEKCCAGNSLCLINGATLIQHCKVTETRWQTTVEPKPLKSSSATSGHFKIYPRSTERCSVCPRSRHRLRCRCTRLYRSARLRRYSGWTFSLNSRFELSHRRARGSRFCSKWISHSCLPRACRRTRPTCLPTRFLAATSRRPGGLRANFQQLFRG